MTRSPVRRCVASALGGAGLVVVALTLLACAPPPPQDEALVLSRAKLWRGAAQTPPPEVSPGWHDRSLPDRWWIAQRGRATEGWYRIEFELAEATPEPFGVLLTSLAQDAEVHLDGRRLGGGRSFGHPSGWLAYHHGLGLYLPIPETSLAAGLHRLDVRLRLSAGRPGSLGEVLVGPQRQLAAVSRHTRFVAVELPRGFGFVAAGIGLLLALVYRGRRDVLGWGWASLGIVLWAASTLMLCFPEWPRPERLFEWSISVSFHWWPLCFALAVRRMVGRPRSSFEWVLIPLWSAISVAYALIPQLSTFPLGILWTVADLAVGGYLLALLVQAARAGSVRRGWLLACAGLTVGALAIYDLLGTRSGVALWHVYALPAVTLSLGWGFFARVREAFDESEKLNQELEIRVADKSRELSENYARLAELERERAVAGERERIMQDMHDGMGGQLVSTLALVEAAGDGDARVADALRSALDDLRIMLDSLDPTQDDLLGMLATLRSRLEPRLEGTGLHFDWEVGDVPPLHDFGPENVAHVLRIVQEAFTNVIKHAGASTISVRTGAARDERGREGVFVLVRDDGGGFAAGSAGGRGLGNMRRRAEAVGGELSVESGEQGTAVRLWIPLGASATPTPP